MTVTEQLAKADKNKIFVLIDRNSHLFTQLSILRKNVDFGLDHQ